MACAIVSLTLWRRSCNCCWLCRLCVGSIGSNLIARHWQLAWSCRWLAKLCLESHHTSVTTKVTNRCVTHSQVVLGWSFLVALITIHALVWVSLQVDSVERQAVERAEHLVFVVSFDSLNHVEVGLASVTPGALNNALLLCLEITKTGASAERLGCTFKLYCLNLCPIQTVQKTTVIAHVHRKIVHHAEGWEARITAQLVNLTFEVGLVPHNGHFCADYALGSSRWPWTRSRHWLGLWGWGGLNDFDIIIIILIKFSGQLFGMLVFDKTGMTTEVLVTFTVDWSNKSIHVIAKVLATTSARLTLLLKGVQARLKSRNNKNQYCESQCIIDNS